MDSTWLQKQVPSLASTKLASTILFLHYRLPEMEITIKVSAKYFSENTKK
jgi:hypothetical protein